MKCPADMKCALRHMKGKHRFILTAGQNFIFSRRLKTSLFAKQTTSFFENLKIPIKDVRGNPFFQKVSPAPPEKLENKF